MKTRAIVAVAIASTAALAVAPSASASSTGTTPVGSTITATAWERGGLDEFKYDNIIDSITYSVLPDGGFEEYVYRVFRGSTTVDVQDTVGYESLTEAEQDQWYVDAGYVPYDFTWIAFACLTESDVSTPGVIVSDEISLTEMHYVAADVLYPSNTRDYFADYIFDFQPSLIDGSVFGVAEFVPSHMSVAGYPSYVPGPGGGPLGDMAFSASYPEFACGGDGEVVGFRIFNSADLTDPATERDLAITETLHVDVFGEARELKADGVFIGVTGAVVRIEYNAALWGMTQVSGDLADTGTDATGIALLGGGLAVVGALTAAVRVSRRRA